MAEPPTADPETTGTDSQLAERRRQTEREDGETKRQSGTAGVWHKEVGEEDTEVFEKPGEDWRRSRRMWARRRSDANSGPDACWDRRAQEAGGFGGCQLVTRRLIRAYK